MSINKLIAERASLITILALVATIVLLVASSLTRLPSFNAKLTVVTDSNKIRLVDDRGEEVGSFEFGREGEARLVVKKRSR